jgi:hypothetical protein
VRNERTARWSWRPSHGYLCNGTLNSQKYAPVKSDRIERFVIKPEIRPIWLHQIRLLLLCSDFRHPDNHHEKSNIGRDVSVVLIEIANLEAEVRLERSPDPGRSS